MVRQFQSDSEIFEIGEGLLSCTLPKSKWTHEAHFAATVYLILKKPEIDLEKKMPGIIWKYNESTGGKNTDTSGYHETLTQFYIKIIRKFLKSNHRGEMFEICNQLVSSPIADRNHPLEFWSKELLFSVNARKRWVEPDLKEVY
ncbi:MAG: hypothetical protein KDD25_04595 [Bdellovibrionales bacterium]|nr:hypothetical protein [Bdellovibrionales bacterium]